MLRGRCRRINFGTKKAPWGGTGGGSSQGPRSHGSMGTLEFPDGKRMTLASGQCIPLGRAHLGAIWGAIHVSRVQCEVQLTSVAGSGAKRLRVVSRSKLNPTVIRHCTAEGFRDKVLKDGQVGWMSSGDALALLSVRPGLAVRFFASGGDGEHVCGDSMEGRPSKRAKVEAGGSVLIDPAKRVPRALDAAVPGQVITESVSGESQSREDCARLSGAIATNLEVPSQDSRISNAPPPERGTEGGNDEPKPVMLLLIGVQGSGKSTFSLELQRGGAARWTRINQDSIRPSGKGTRNDCERAARDSLANGSNCIIDRMNLTPSGLKLTSSLVR